MSKSFTGCTAITNCFLSLICEERLCYGPVGMLIILNTRGEFVPRCISSLKFVSVTARRYLTARGLGGRSDGEQHREEEAEEGFGEVATWSKGALGAFEFLVCLEGIWMQVDVTTVISPWSDSAMPDVLDVTEGGQVTSYVALSALEAILDGEDDGSETCPEPWDGVRRRLLEIANRVKRARWRE